MYILFAKGILRTDPLLFNSWVENEDVFDRKKGEGGAKMLLNKIWESLYTSILL